MERALSALSPEMLAQLVALVQNQNTPATPACEPAQEAPVKPKRLSKAYLNTIRDQEVEVRNLTRRRVV